MFGPKATLWNKCSKVPFPVSQYFLPFLLESYCMPLLGAKGQHICCSNAATRQFTCAGTWSAKFDLSNWNDKFWYDFALFKVQVFSLPEYNAYLPFCVKGFVVCYTERNFLVFWATDAAQGKMCSAHLHREKNNSIEQKTKSKTKTKTPMSTPAYLWDYYHED